MDSLTHIVLGACIGEAFFEKGFGKKAMLWGALAQSIPDIDFIASAWMTTPEALLAHRGFTHSILFAFLVIPIFALTADKIHRPHNIPFSRWLLFFAAEIFTHLFIDTFNNYGVGWLEPFSHLRFSFNIIYVADPFFSIWPGLACLVLFILNPYDRRRKFWWKFGVWIPLIYLTYGTLNKIKITRDVQEIFAEEKIPYHRYFTTPAPLQNWLWYVVAGNDSGYYVGYRSLFDDSLKINFTYFPRNEYLQKNIGNNEDFQKLIRFSQQFYTLERYRDTLVFNDLRFGQILGWENPRGKFVFHYFLSQTNKNKTVVQRGRFEKWDWESLLKFIQRIKGN